MEDVSDEALRTEVEPLLRGDPQELARSSESTAADCAPVQFDQQSVGRPARMSLRRLIATTRAAPNREAES
jgi:hypothetical protein